MDQPTTAPATSGHIKQYVFVDEYNRHKRLKVMRACDGCRKRKIRCDGALQNGPWPCGACLRLKLKCVPPTLDQDDEQHTPDSTTSTSSFSFHTAIVGNSNTSNGMSSHPTMVHEWTASVAPRTPISTAGPTSAPVQDDIDTSVYSSQLFSQQLGPRMDPGYHDDQYFASATAPAQFQSSHSRPEMPSLLRTQTSASSNSGGDPQEVDAAVRELSERMGELTVDHTAVAPYIANQKKNLADAPAVEEVEVVLPPSVSTDSTVRIPPEMMPSDERAMDYFGYFFDYVHPYVPVLNRQAFYDQWRTARHSMSPLILEGIFACVARYLEEPNELRRWLALASRHEESFKDVPRLSTIQAMIILTKAREVIPKRGYYYRSWMAVKYMTTMAFDLGLHEHLAEHQVGSLCKLSRADCMVRTRIWHMLFTVEILVGAPQGRTDFAIEVETVDFELPATSPEMDAFEQETCRRSTYFAQAVRNIKTSNNLWQTMRRYKKDWALDPSFLRQNEAIPAWLNGLPTDLQIHFDDDDSPPWLGGDHFVAYLHVYHYLIVVMHHRPQLQALLEKKDPNFRTPLDTCNEAASLMCRLQEALIRDFGIHGLQFMQRGVNFNIYCILTCTMLHLVSFASSLPPGRNLLKNSQATITSPDPVANSRARMFFTRHMRVLEHCISSTSPEMQVQINALREAFSQDTSKSFELKPTLGLRSPALDQNPSPLSAHPHSAPVQGTPAWSHLQDNASSKTMSPASEYSHPFEQIPNPPRISYHPTSNYTIPSQTAYSSANLQQVTSAPQSGYTLEPVISNEHTQPVWDPSGIFNQWNTAFGAGAQAQQAAAQPAPQGPNSHVQPTSAPIMPQQQSPAVQHPIFGSQQISPSVSSVPAETVPTMPTVTPVMWQDAFTSAYVSAHGQKRYREETMEPNAYHHYQKRRG